MPAASVFVVADGEALEVLLAVGEVADGSLVVVAFASDRLVDTSSTHAELDPLPEHVYPKGQQLEPHWGKLSLSLVVNISPVGFCETSCFDTSQSMGRMTLQLLPAGQQSADEELSREMQPSFVGQVKLEGS